MMNRDWTCGWCGGARRTATETYHYQPFAGLEVALPRIQCGERPIVITENGGWRSPKTVQADHRKR